MTITVTGMSLNEALADIRERKRFRVAPSEATPKKVFLNCHYCGYAPGGRVPSTGACPKCGGSSWERFTVSRRLLPKTVG